jgi:putative membrane protein
MMGWNWDGGWWLGMGVGMIVWVLITVLIVVLVVRALIGPQPPRNDPPRNEPPSRQEPEAILRERFARGEIDADEYQRRLDLLRM